MRPVDVALATTHPLPEPDPCEAPLLSALAERGLRAASWPWRDPSVDWSRASLVVLRATWDYPWHAQAFDAWLARVAAVSRLFNPLPAARWNLHKGYLLDLAAADVPVVPTRLVKRHAPQPLEPLCQRLGWQDVVVKPAVGAGSFETWRARWSEAPDEAARVARRFTALCAERDMLVQPCVRSVLREGERSLVFVDGALSHVMHKAPRFAGEHERVTGPHPPRPADVALAERALTVARRSTGGTQLLYARVDLVDADPGVDGRAPPPGRQAIDASLSSAPQPVGPTPRGAAPRAGRAPMVSELELLEPSLFLAAHPPAAAQLAAALARALD